MAKELVVMTKEDCGNPWKGRGVKRKFASTRKGEEMIKSLLLAHRVTD